METSAAHPAADHCEREVDNVVERSSGCCKTRCFGGHTTQDAGLSFWVHPYFLAASRFASFLILIVLSILKSIPDPVCAAINIFAWAMYLESATFLMLAICSVCGCLGRGAGVLPSLTVPLHHTACALALYNFPFAVWFHGNAWLWPHLVFAVSPLALFLLDTSVFGARVRFRVAYVWIPFLLFGVTNALWFIPYHSREVFVVEHSVQLWGFFLLAAWCIAAAFIAIVITVLTQKCGGKLQRNCDNDVEVLASNA